MRSLMFAIVVSAHAATFAYDWPSSGTATIPDGEAAAITDADAANVANLDAIVLGTGSSVTSDVLAAKLTLKADVSGPGTLTFKNCPGVTWAGNGSLVVMEEGGAFEWPTEPGAIAKIPETKEVTVTDKDIHKLAILGGIQVKSLANLIFDGLTNPYDLAVPLSGYGTVTVEDCARFAIVANNTNFLGHFEFSNTDTVVSNRFALGCIDSQPTKFTAGANGHFRFMGEGLTNDVALVLGYNTGPFPYGTDETLVQNAGITLQPGPANSNFHPRNLTMTRGTLEQENKSQTLYFTEQAGCTLTIGPEAGIKFGGAHMQAGYVGHYVYNTTNVSYSSYNHYDYGADLKFGIKNAFYKREIDCNTGSPGYGIDLGGFDQWLETIGPNQYATAQGETRYQRIHSDTPATLTIAPTAADRTMSLKFTDWAGLTFAGKYDSSKSVWHAYTIANQCSDTKGTLTVESSTLKFKWGAGWFGTNVVVKGTGTLKVEDTARQDFFTPDNATTRSRTQVTIEDEGKIDLGTGIAARVGYLKVNGQVKDRGIYGGPDSAAEIKLDCFTGAGTITVQRGSRNGLMVNVR